MRNSILVLTLLFCVQFVAAESYTSDKIWWRSMNDVIANKGDIENTILIYIDEKGGSAAGKRMEKTTLKDPAVVQYLRYHFLTAKFDAKDFRTYEINGLSYTYDKLKGQHEFITEWIDEGSPYPAFVMLDEHMDYLGTISGFVSIRDLMDYLHYYREPYKKYEWEEFRKGTGQIVTDNIPLIMEDYPNGFRNLMGEVVKEEYGVTTYQSKIIIPGAINSYIYSGENHGKHHAYFKSLVAENISYEEGMERLQAMDKHLAESHIKEIIHARVITRKTAEYDNHISKLIIPFEPKEEYERLLLFTDLEVTGFRQGPCKLWIWVGYY